MVMHGCNKYLFCKYTYVRSFLCLMHISGIIFTSSALLADVPLAITKYTLQSDNAPEVISPPQQKQNIPEIEIIEQNGIYQIKVVANIDASASHVRHVLTDFQHIYRLNPSIIESDVVERHDDESVSVRTKVIGCAAYFCEELERVERVRVLPSGDLLAEIVPEQSQFKSGQTLWSIKSLGDQCEVSYSSDIEPDIFIPPVVGKFLIKKSIREEMQISFANLERISNVLAEREWRENYHSEHAEFASYYPCINDAENSLSNTH